MIVKEIPLQKIINNVQHEEGIYTNDILKSSYF